ncbi:MAG: hypothetical protein RBJ76_18205 [Stenomitos frigidus ULC029]
MQFNVTVRSLLVGLSILSLGVVGCSQPRNFEADSQNQAATIQPEPSLNQVQDTSNPTTEAPTRTPDVVYVPTPVPVVNEMLRLANVQSNDVVYDLGSGDGRIVITAAQKVGARGIGIDKLMCI